MNKSIVFSLAGFVTGAFVSFLVTKKMLEQKYVMLAEEEISSVKEEFEKYRHPVVKPKAPINEVVSDVKVTEEVVKEATEKVAKVRPSKKATPQE